MPGSPSTFGYAIDAGRLRLALSTLSRTFWYATSRSTLLSNSMFTTLTDSELDAYFDKVCGNDTELRARIEELRAAGWYEKPGIKYTLAYVPYLHYCDEAVAPLGESRNEWEIFWRLAQEVQRVAQERDTRGRDPLAEVWHLAVEIVTPVDVVERTVQHLRIDAGQLRQRLLQLH